jgi:DNA helicase-2/ATP-dependent DNA helicase PcrA
MQDTNPLQYDLLSSFYEDCHLFCVGDDAQSIYGFRGADFKSIHQFKDIVKDSEVCKLTINYRSTQEILDLSNWVIAQSPLDYDKQLIANRGAGFKPIFKHWSSEWEEANDIALSILQSHNELGKRWKDNLILSRTIWSSKKVEATLIKYKIPYTNYGGRGLMQSRHIRDVVSSMRIVSNYLDEIAWSRYLQLWKNIGEVTAADIIGKVITTDSLDDCLMILLEITQKKRLQEEIANTLITISDLQHSPSKAITQSLKIMQPWLEQLYKDDWSWRKEDFPLLVEISKSTGSISEFVAEYVLDPKLEITQKNGGKLEDHVVLSTIHSAKGLEADNVYVINASVDSYPTQRAILNGEEAVEEERRCLYVALTRAKDYLYVYRNIQSVHIADKELDKYFLNNVPETLYNSENIAVNYVPQLKNITGEQIRIDIYNDLDFK